MGLEAVKEEIISSARKQEESLLAEARQDAAKIMEMAEKQAEEFREKIEAETDRMADIIKKQELASAELESKKALLEAKKQMIDGVFAEAQKKIAALDAKKNEAYIKKLLAKAKNDIEVETVYCSRKDAKLLKELNAEEAEIIGGIIAENKDKTVRVDCSFDAMLQSINENELQSISRILFG